MNSDPVNKKQRLIYRFRNFANAMSLLEEGLAISTPSKTERAGIIQFYEMAFELGWKALKDYFEVEGLNPKFPRETIKTGIQYGIIGDRDLWMEALNDRNLTVHTYDEESAIAIEKAIRKHYYKLLKNLARFLDRTVKADE